MKIQNSLKILSMYIFLLFFIYYFFPTNKIEAQSTIQEENLTEIREQIEEYGYARVIIGLDVPFTPTGYLPDQVAIQAQEQSIRRAQTVIINQLARFDTTPVYTNWKIPAVSYVVDEHALRMLENSPFVRSMTLVKLSGIALEESIDIVSADTFHNYTPSYLGTGQTVAILDTGVDSSHPFLAGAVIAEACFSNTEGYSNATPLCPGGVQQMIGTGAGQPCDASLDGCEHGTHVAGIVGGDGLNSGGVAPNANIIAVQVFVQIDDSAICEQQLGTTTPCIGTLDDDQIAALNYINNIRNNMGVGNLVAVNLSLGRDQYPTSCDDNNTEYTSIVNDLYTNGIAVIAASGNEGFINSIAFPACINNVVSVGNTTKEDEVYEGTSGSNTASFLDLLAPGTDITSSVLNDQFGSMTGTSQAAPHVAGAFALMKQRYPNATIAEILSLLKSNGEPVTDTRSNVNITKPRLDLESLADCVSFPTTVYSAEELIKAIVCANLNGSSTDRILFGTNITLTSIDNRIEGNNGLPSIRSSIIIGGLGNTLERSYAISDAFRLFYVESTGNLKLYNITLRNGSAPDELGGAIFNGGEVVLSNSTISGNSAWQAGGIVNVGTLTVTNSTLSGNSADNQGGGIFNFGTLTVTNSTLSGNSASWDAGGIFNYGGISTVTNSTLSGNSAKDGGGISNFGTLTVTNSTLSDNSAPPGSGGGIYNYGGGNLTVTNSILSGNSATWGGGISNFSRFNGGGDTLTVSNSTLSGNSATHGGGIYNYGGTATVINSIVWGNDASTDPQIYNNGTLTLDHIGVQNLASVNVTNNNGGNLNLSSSDDVFVAPEPASNAPTTAGDYHLADGSPVINQGDNASVPASITVDIDGDPRIMGGTVDMGADEWGVPIPLPPTDTNLIYNPGFTLSANNDAGWRFYGSIEHEVINGRMKLDFPTSVNGWMRQFRTAYPLPTGLHMVGYVTVSNQDPVAKNFQVIFRDSDLMNTYMCNFTIPGNTWNKTYYMRFITATDWEIIRVDIRPNVVDANGLRFDNVNLRYRPWLTFTEKECIPPTFSDETPTSRETELVTVQHAAPLQTDDDVGCNALDWSDTVHWNGYLPTSEVQFVFDPFNEMLLSDGIYDQNGDGVADTLYDALSYGNPPSVYGGNEGGSISADATLIREAVIAMLNDRHDSNHPEAWWAVEIDTVEALGQGENAQVTLAQQYATSNATCR